jgi:RNA polymerase sigma factor (sigma-70 family)
VFDFYYRELLNFLSRKVADRATAADLTQESFTRVYAAHASGSAIREPRALLYQVARNLLVDHHRRAGVRSDTELPLGQAEEVEAPGPRDWEPETALSSRQGVSALIETIDGLPPRCRLAFMLNRFDGLTYAQVAARMEISVKAVEQHLKHALDACERCRASLAGDTADVLARRRKLNRSRHE